jgi:hypothetical protein
MKADDAMMGIENKQSGIVAPAVRLYWAFMWVVLICALSDADTWKIIDSTNSNLINSRISSLQHDETGTVYIECSSYRMYRYGGLGNPITPIAFPGQDTISGHPIVQNGTTWWIGAAGSESTTGSTTVIMFDKQQFFLHG